MRRVQSGRELIATKVHLCEVIWTERHDVEACSGQDHVGSYSSTPSFVAGEKRYEKKKYLGPELEVCRQVT